MILRTIIIIDTQKVPEEDLTNENIERYKNEFHSLIEKVAQDGSTVNVQIKAYEEGTEL